MNYLYKLVTTENVEINYDTFNKKEFIECLATMRNIYFSLKQENKQLKEVIDKLELENKVLKENNMSMQEEMARTWEKGDLYKEVIEEVRDRITIKLGRYINEKDYVIDDVALDELLQILDKAIGDDK